MKKHSNIPIFIPELACPHQCVFCNQQKISGTFSSPKPEEIVEIIEKYLATMSTEKRVEIAFFGGSFTGISIDLQEQYLKIAHQYIQTKKVSGIRLSTRPDYIKQEILDLLKKYGVSTIELGAQSTNDDVLRKSGRGHNFESIKTASELILKNGFELGLQMMIGLPSDSLERTIQTANDIVNLGASSTRIYPTLVIKETALAKLYEKGNYSPLSLENAVLWTKEIVQRFEKNNVKILRVGLHPSEELSYEKSLVAGPYHIALNEMVMTEIWNDLLIKRLKDWKIRRFEDLKIFVNLQQLNYAIGYQQKNRKTLQNLGFKVKFVGDEKFEKYEIEIK